MVRKKEEDEMIKTIEQLKEIPDMASQVQALLDTRTTPPTGTLAILHPTPVNSRIPLNLTLWSILGDELTRLTGTMRVIEEESIRSGTLLPSWPIQKTIATVCEWLSDEKVVFIWENNPPIRDWVADTCKKIYNNFRRALHIENDLPTFTLNCPQIIDSQPCRLSATLDTANQTFFCPAGHQWKILEVIEQLNRIQPHTAAQAARILGIKRTTINVWHVRGKLTPIGYLGKRPLYALDDISAISILKT
jgi:hypothetical protein